MLKKILIAVALIILAILGFAATKPDEFTVSRTATIHAPPEKIYPYLENFRKWAEWSPFEKLDPAMKRTFGGPESGQGATYAWAGNSKAGEGKMEIVEAVPPSKVGIQLDFIKPFASRNSAVFTLTPKGDSTAVTWMMSGKSPYMAKVMTVFFSMDKMVGKDFEEGLGKLKAVAER